MMEAVSGKQKGLSNGVAKPQNGVAELQNGTSKSSLINGA
jgi:hypothetical protein